ncbi:MAG TPA: Ig-like domain-containing protein [Gemmatimonadaceae bacterium]
MLTTGSRIATRLALVAWTVTSGLSACSKNTPAAPAAPVAASIISTTLAANLVAPVATGIPGGVSVQVLDATGAPVSGVTVSWTAFNGGIASEAATTTDSNGKTSIAWQFGTIAGADSLQASVGTTVSTYIVGTALAGPVAQLVEVAGDQDVLGEGVSAQLVVKAVDQYGNAVSNSTVAWIDQGGGVLSGTSTMTDANGLATVTLTTDMAPEQYVIVAQDGTASVTFVDTSM